MPEPMIANLDESTAHYIKLSAQRDGSFTVTNSRTKETRTYKAPNVDGRPAAFSDFRREVPGAVAQDHGRGSARRRTGHARREQPADAGRRVRRGPCRKRSPATPSPST